MKISGPFITQEQADAITKAVSALQSVIFTIRAGSKRVSSRLVSGKSGSTVDIDIAPVVPGAGSPVVVAPVGGVLTLSFQSSDEYDVTISSATTLVLTEYYYGAEMKIYLRNNSGSSYNLSLPAGMVSNNAGLTSVSAYSAKWSIITIKCLGTSAAECIASW